MKRCADFFFITYISYIIFTNGVAWMELIMLNNENTGVGLKTHVYECRLSREIPKQIGLKHRCLRKNHSSGRVDLVSFIQNLFRFINFQPIRSEIFPGDASVHSGVTNRIRAQMASILISTKNIYI